MTDLPLTKLVHGTNTYEIKDTAARESLNNKQDTLVSGTNIKTINDQSLLGSGNIVIEASGTPDVDDDTVSYNTDNELQTIGVINQRDGNALKIWHGTQAQWNQGESIPWYYWQTAGGGVSFESSTLPNKDHGAYIWYLNNKFVISPYRGTIYYTSNGSTWETTSAVITGATSTQQSINYTAFGNNTLVGVAMYGSYASLTTDGINWETAALPSNYTWRAIAFGNNTFVTIAMYNNYAAYSTDNGVTWHSSTLPSNNNWYNLIFGNNVFVAIKNTDEAAYSTDNGATWTATTLNDSAQRNAYCYGGDKFVLLSYNSDFVNYSTDGINWSSTQLPISGNWQSVNYLGGKFIAFSSNTSAVYSVDGVIWYECSLPSDLESTSFDIYYEKNQYVAIGRGKSYALTSTNGITWSKVNLPTNVQGTGTAYGNGTFVVITSNVTNAAYANLATIQSCFTDTTTPTTTSTIYSAPDTVSALTISSVTSDAITLSDNNTYYYDQSGNQYTYSTVGSAHPNWICFIEGVGIKKGNTMIANNLSVNQTYDTTNKTLIIS